MHCLRYLLLAIVVCAPGVGVQISAQAPVDTAHYAVTYVSVMPTARASAVAAVKQYRDASRKQDGFVRIELFEQVGRPGNYVLVEAWKEPPAFDAHLKGAHAMQFRDTLQPLRVTGYDERPYKNFSVAPATGSASGDAIHVVTHLDTVGGPQGGGPDLARKMAEASRREPGCLRFDVLQGTTRANHFTIVETWADQKAYDAHLSAPHTKQYRETVQPVTGSPLDERVYKAVE
ncbi:MAG TPA: antibiotic biosynthesis monooxygenase [Vicinamibacterales bacterium]